MFLFSQLLRIVFYFTVFLDICVALDICVTRAFIRVFIGCQVSFRISFRVFFRIYRVSSFGRFLS